MKSLVLMYLVSPALLFQAASVGTAPNQLTPDEKKDGYTLLFNGTNLDGWEGDPVRWKVENGAIAGNSVKDPNEGWKMANPLVRHGDWNTYESWLIEITSA